MVRKTQLLHTPRPPVTPRPAATVLLLRDGPQGLEVLMTRRAMTASFAPAPMSSRAAALMPRMQMLPPTQPPSAAPPKATWI